jgi:hypothetical protein
MAVKARNLLLRAILIAGLSLSLPLFAFASIIYGADTYGSGTYAGSAPVVTTDSASAIGQTAVTLGGTITSIGSTSPSVRGFVYGANTSYGATTTDTTGAPFSTGSFSAAISSLTCNTSYHFAAYATSTNGTGYGSDLTFMTSACSSGGVVTPVSRGGGGVISGPLSIGFQSSVATTTSTSSTTVSSVSIGQLATSTPAETNSVVRENSSIIYLQQNRQLNDTGEDIRSLQKFLNSRGFVVAPNGPGSIGNETSLFRVHTYRALIQFQSAHGLPATGYLGPMTRSLINGKN